MSILAPGAIRGVFGGAVLLMAGVNLGNVPVERDAKALAPDVPPEDSPRDNVPKIDIPPVKMAQEIVETFRQSYRARVASGQTSIFNSCFSSSTPVRNSLPLAQAVKTIRSGSAPSCNPSVIKVTYDQPDASPIIILDAGHGHTAAVKPSKHFDPGAVYAGVTETSVRG